MLRAVAAAVCLSGTVLIAQTGTQPPRFVSGVERIAIDVQVIDSEGRPLTDLTLPDFEVRIGGQLRTIVAAQFVQAAALDTAAGGARDRQPTSAAAPVEAGSPGGRDFILAIDEASFRPTDALAAIRAAKMFVQRLAPRDRVGLFTFPVSPNYFPLTPDHIEVSMALNRVTGRLDMPQSRYHLSPSEVIDIEAGDADAVSLVARRECLPQPTYQVECRKAIPGEANIIVQAYESQATATVAALRTLLAALRQDPQRKTVLLLSGGLLSSDRVGGRPNVAGIIDMIADESAKADANLYVLHMDSSFLQAFSPNNGRPVSRSLMRETMALGAGLDRLAGVGGGALLRAEPGMEDAAFLRILRETSAYYMLAVEPADGDRDGRLHPISVKTSVAGADVRARRSVIVPRKRTGH